MATRKPLTLRYNAQALRHHGALQSIYVVFRADLKAVETVEFRQNGVILLDKGEDGYPVAAQVIFDKGLTARDLEHSRVEPIGVDLLAAEGNRPPAAPNPELAFENAVLALYFMSTEMLRYHECQQQRKGNELIKEAVEAIKAIPGEKLAYIDA